jgi:hypothetical protein
VLLGHEVVHGDDHRHTRVQERTGHPRRVEEVVAAPRLAGLDQLAVALGRDLLQAGQEAARIAPDTARIVRRPGVEADPHVGDPFLPLPTSLTPSL